MLPNNKFLCLIIVADAMILLIEGKINIDGTFQYYGAEPGTCEGSFTRYYFDNEEIKCKPFTYTGCGGNENNFPDEEQCYGAFKAYYEMDGKIPSCSENEDNTNNVCNKRRTIFRYDTSSKTCETGEITGCQRLYSVFKDMDQCSDVCHYENRRKCISSKHYIQYAPEGNRIAYTYDQSINNCVATQMDDVNYTGSGFDDIFECRKNCKYRTLESKCNVTPNMQGKCKENDVFYTYSSTENKCVQIVFGKCNSIHPSNNLYSTLIDCVMMCGDNSNEYKIETLCLPSQKANLQSLQSDISVKRWVFDEGEKKCKEVEISGAYNQGDFFKAEVDCNSICG